MRTNMSKIITEPARSGVGYYRTLSNDYRRAQTFKLDEDLNVNDEFSARVLSMRGKSVGWEGKSHRLSYRAVARFLRSRVGSVWNDVYSEIATACKTEAAKALDLHDLFTQNVETHTYVGDDGFTYYYTRHGGGGRCVEEDHNTLYVDPRDGILRLSPGESYKTLGKKRSAEAAAEAALTHREIDGLKFEKIDDVWFKVKVTRQERINGQGRVIHPHLEIVTKLATVSKADLKLYKLN